MFDIKKLIAATTCALVLCSAATACSGNGDKGKSDGFTISEVSSSGSASDANPDIANREQEDVSGVIGEVYDYYGVKYTVNSVSELDVEQYPGGKVVLIDLSLTNESEYEQSAGVYANFDVHVDGEGETSDFVTAQVMTIMTRYFVAQNIDRTLFGTGEAPVVKPGETVSGVIPLAITSEIADFQTITLSFLPDITAGVYNSITIDITPDDIVPYVN